MRDRVPVWTITLLLGLVCVAAPVPLQAVCCGPAIGGPIRTGEGLEVAEPLTMPTLSDEEDRLQIERADAGRPEDPEVETVEPAGRDLPTSQSGGINAIGLDPHVVDSDRTVTYGPLCDTATWDLYLEAEKLR
jgi:hypothetical protein